MSIWFFYLFLNKCFVIKELMFHRIKIEWYFKNRVWILNVLTQNMIYRTQWNSVAPVLSGHLWENRKLATYDRWPLIPGSNMKIKFWSWHIRYCCFHTFSKLEPDIQNKWNVYFTFHRSLLYCSPLKPCVFVLRCYSSFSTVQNFGKKSSLG